MVTCPFSLPIPGECKEIKVSFQTRWSAEQVLNWSFCITQCRQVCTWHLKATKGHLNRSNIVVVDETGTGLKVLHHTVGPLHISTVAQQWLHEISTSTSVCVHQPDLSPPGEDTCSQAQGGVIGSVQHLLFSFKRQHRHDRAKDLFLHTGHVISAVTCSTQWTHRKGQKCR